MITGRFALELERISPPDLLVPPQGEPRHKSVRWRGSSYDHHVTVSNFAELWQADQEGHRALTRAEKFQRGQLTTDDLDDEELARQCVRNDDGTFPRVRPALHITKIGEMQRALLQRGNDVFAAAFIEATQTMREICTDPNNPPQVRLQAAKMIVDKVAPTATVIEIKPHDPVLSFFEGIHESGATELITGTVVPDDQLEITKGDTDGR